MLVPAHANKAEFSRVSLADFNRCNLRMKQYTVLFLGALLILATGEAIAAAPEVTLDVIRGRHIREIDFNITLSASPTGCAFGVYATPRRAAINRVPNRGIRIASFHRDQTEIALRSWEIPPVDRKNRKKGRFAYFRVLTDCNGELSLSNSATYRVPFRKQNTVGSIRKWIRRIKNMINYAELVP
jgi:hypothetical protein